MKSKTADQIRYYVNEVYIEPARKSGKSQVAVRAGDVHKELELNNRMPSVCGALDAQKFQEQFGVILSKREGPKFGATVIWHFGVNL